VYTAGLVGYEDVQGPLIELVPFHPVREAIRGFVLLLLAIYPVAYAVNGVFLLLGDGEINVKEALEIVDQ
jgi:hypothetical protein